ncbi:tetratricopeptide repeat protein [Ralstonia insidiosa]|uniref:Tetratricopeptide repeat protein n=1 Tax=Ralstonia insidiosa TaxID=190721 RepID=A0A848P8I8_9RALS|nr:tetratricopeptide repeat protein [Ralstonia insidiosa]NMV40936.1 tetratricopeptide repeat protein [Ralstonia insidiosa]
MLSRLSAALLGAAFFCSAVPAAARDWIAPTATLGRGAQVHQFVLTDPSTGKPMPNARYRLFLPGHTIAGKPPKKDENDSVIFGTTDGAGRTAKVRLPKRYPAARWILNPVIGQGEFGESFHLVGTSSGDPMGGYPYLLDVTDEYLICGRANAGGYSYYAQSRESRAVQLDIDMQFTPEDYAWCAGPGRAIANADAAQSPSALYTQYLGALTANGTTLSEGFQNRLARKLISLAIAERNPEHIDYALDLRPVPDDKLNGYGYDLADAGLRVERGLSMIEAYLAQHPDDPFALDSKGWALYRLGHNEEALTWLDRSIAIFNQPDGSYGVSDDAVRDARAEGLAHKGEVLWGLGRTDEAQEAFKQGLAIWPKSDALQATLARLAVTLPTPTAQ